jgi:hypothetical protein
MRDKLLVRVLMFLVLAWPGVGKAPTAEIQEGHPLVLLTEEFMKSGQTPTGSTVRFRVDRDVILPDGRILIPANAEAIGEVLKSEPHGLFGQAGELNFAIRSVTAADGTAVPLRAIKNAEGDSIMAPVIVGAVLVTPLALLFNGPNVEIPAHTAFTAYVDKTTAITKPLPPRLDKASLGVARSVTIITPKEGALVEKSDKVVFAVSLTPADENAYIRLYLDDKVIKIQKGSPSRIEWTRSESVDDGVHRLEAEVTFQSGHVVKSPVVPFTLE